MSKPKNVFPWPTILGVIALIAFGVVLFRMQQPRKYTGPIKYIELTSENFDKVVLESDVPVLVDFYADWCGPCRRMAPSIAELAAETEGKAVVGKLNVDDQRALAIRHDVSSLPSLSIFVDGREVQRYVGYTEKEILAAALDGFATPVASSE